MTVSEVTAVARPDAGSPAGGDGASPATPARSVPGRWAHRGPHHRRLLGAAARSINADGHARAHRALAGADGLARQLRPGRRRTAARRPPGREFSDSEVYKLLEAMAWEYGRTGDPELDAPLPTPIAARVAAAQEPDGYLNTASAGPGSRRATATSSGATSCTASATCSRPRSRAAAPAGDDDLLPDVARRAADHVCAEFGPDGSEAICGHPEIEVGLAELGRVTGEHALPRAGAAVRRAPRPRHAAATSSSGRAYFQDDVPVRDAECCAATPCAPSTSPPAPSTSRSTRATTSCWMRCDGSGRDRSPAARTSPAGMGSHHQDEAFGDDWELPPDRAYSRDVRGHRLDHARWRLLLARGRPAVRRPDRAHAVQRGRDLAAHGRPRVLLREHAAPARARACRRPGRRTRLGRRRRCARRGSRCRAARPTSRARSPASPRTSRRPTTTGCSSTSTPRADPRRPADGRDGRVDVDDRYPADGRAGAGHERRRRPWTLGCGCRLGGRRAADGRRPRPTVVPPGRGP